MTGAVSSSATPDDPVQIAMAPRLPGTGRTRDSFASDLATLNEFQASDLPSSPSYTTLVPVGADADEGWDGQSMRTLVATPPDRRRPAVAPRPLDENPLLEQFPCSFSLQSGMRSKSWATLYARDLRPLAQQRASPAMLRLAGGECLQGVLELNLESSQAIASIKIALKGKVVTGYLEHQGSPLIEHKVSVWDRSLGDPGNATPGIPSNGKFGPGTYQFPVSFRFPSQANVVTLKGADDTSSLETPRSVQPSAPVAQTSSRFSFLRRSSKSSSKTQSVAQSDTDGPPAQSVSGADPDVHVLPPTFLEKTVKANTRYELSLSINHGKLRPESKLRIPVTYMGSSDCPQPCSAARQLALRYRTPIPGPANDPEGWCTLPSTTLSGFLFGSTRVDATSTLSLAIPLSYTRGTAIPCHLSISCADTTALSQIATPSVQRVCLTRTVRYIAAEQDARDAPPGTTGMAGTCQGPTAVSLADELMTSRDHAGRGKGKGKNARASASFSATDPLANDNDSKLNMRDSDTISTAVWWPASGPESETTVPHTTRVLEGEIYLPETMHPSCLFPVFQILYTVDILSPEIPGFASDDSQVPNDGKHKRRMSSTNQQESPSRVYHRQVVSVVTTPRFD